MSTSIRRALPLSALCLLATLCALAACSGSKDTDRVCAPGKSEACAGPGGCAGAQQCNAEGTGYGACDCGSATGQDGGEDTSSDGGTDGGETTVSCNLLTQAGCAANERCGWVVLEGGAGAARCVAIGAGALDAACTYGPPGETTGHDDCGAGLVCTGERCAKPCDLAAGSTSCAGAYACSRYALLQDASQTAVAGLCEPRCDPLTQVRLADSAPACGSTNPSSPDRGCYYTEDTGFTCMPVLSGAANLRHRDPALGTTSRDAHVNGCAPGFLPLLRRATGDPTIVCIALCSPAETHSGATTQRQGVSPHSCPERGATGSSEECRFWWSVEGTPSEDPGNVLGYCFDPTKYTYDHDNDPGTANVQTPSCASLPNTDSADPDTEPDHVKHGCAPLPSP